MGIAAAVAGAAVVGAGASIVSGNKAAKAQKNAAKQASDTERYQYDTTRADYAPYRQVGQGALYKLADMYGVSRPVDSPQGIAQPGFVGNGVTNPLIRAGLGFTGLQLPTGSTAAAPGQKMTHGYDGFQASPGYQFRLGEGMKAVERSAAARGLLGSGGTVKAVQRYGEGLASQEWENYANALRSMAGIGQTSTNAVAQAGQQAAGAISQNTINAGNAQASSYANTGAAINNGISNIAGAYLMGGFGGGNNAGAGTDGNIMVTRGQPFGL